MSKKPETVGTEWFPVKRTLTKTAQKKHRRQMEETHEKQKEAQSALKSFRDFANPIIRAELDPSYTKGKRKNGAGRDLPEVRALVKELTRRTRHKTARIAMLKAEREFHFDAAADGYLYEIVECDLVPDGGGTQIHYVVRGTGEKVHQRAASGTERQMLLPGDQLPAETKSKGRKRARGAVE